MSVMPCRRVDIVTFVAPWKLLMNRRFGIFPAILQKPVCQLVGNMADVSTMLCRANNPILSLCCIPWKLLMRRQYTIISVLRRNLSLAVHMSQYVGNAAEVSLVKCIYADIIIATLVLEIVDDTTFSHFPGSLAVMLVVASRCNICPQCYRIVRCAEPICQSGEPLIFLKTIPDNHILRFYEWLTQPFHHIW